MDVNQTNRLLSEGKINTSGLFPHVEELKQSPFIFKIHFGLDELPKEPGLIIIRGARQYGKSTWLETQLRKTIKDFGPGTAFYLNGDILINRDELSSSIRELIPLFTAKGPIKRLFIDEITSIKDWQIGLKILFDSGELRNILVVTTGSKATDLMRGKERLPGRKGRLDRTGYIFTPVSYAEFKKVCGKELKEKTLPAYILSGGSPVACSELAFHKRLPEYVVEMVRDWIYGECSASGRQRASLLAVMNCLTKYSGVPVGQAKLAREAGLANNTVAAGYIGLLSDLLTVTPSYAWDNSRRMRITRKPCKYHFTNLLVAVAWDTMKMRTIDDFQNLSPEKQGYWLEWLVAQEVWRRAAIRGEEFPETMNFWQSKQHEIDFVLNSKAFLEVKRGNASPLDYAWFHKTFPSARLTVINQQRFVFYVKGITFEDFLMEEK